MRLKLIHYILTTLFAGVLLSACSAYAASKHPNVILIYADDMGYGEIQALNPKRGKILTPQLDQLVLQGMTFTDAHTTSSVCSPSRYGLLTGRYNWRSRLQRGVLHGGEACLIAPDRMTLGSLFNSQGYHTALIGKWHLGFKYDKSTAPEGSKGVRKSAVYYSSGKPIGTRIVDGPMTRGFDHFFGYDHSGFMSNFIMDDRIVEEVKIIDVLPRLTEAVTAYIDDRAADAKAGNPFFLYFPMSSPHSPVVPSQEWQGKSGIGPHGDFVMQTDASVGAVMEALERNGLSENTILIFSADNGTSGPASKISELKKQGHFPSGDFRGDKTSLWEGGHRVPFILRWPARVEANTRSNQMISLADMMATFADLFSVKLDDRTAEDSMSFLAAIDGEKVASPRTSVVSHSVHGRFTIREGDWKLLLAPGSGGSTQQTDIQATAQGLPEIQLYNLMDDIGEQNNLAAQYPEKVATLIALLESTVANGRSTPGAVQSNDTKVDIWKKNLNQIKKKSKKKN